MGGRSNFRAALTNEYNLTRSFFENVDDLATGIRAKLIDKTNNPVWQPEKYEDVKSVDSVFTDKPKTFEFHNDRDFSDYPLNYALPSTLDVRQVVLKSRRATKQDIIAHFCKRYEDKMGVKELVSAIVEEHVVAINNELKWISTVHNKQ